MKNSSAASRNHHHMGNVGGKLPRNISAPYQVKGDSNSGVGRSSGNGNGLGLTPLQALEQEASASVDVPDHVDYRSFTFQPLESPHAVQFDDYCGPTPESNWVVPGKLLVGAYPASTDDAETLDLITSILQLGITKFVCLQQEYREQGVTEVMWRSGQALRPYFHDVRSIIRKKAMLPCLKGEHIVSAENLTFVHFPIRDCGITDDDRVVELARSLVKAIAEGSIIYLHCWGGHGRTGTLVCIMLHLMYGYNDVHAMLYCQTVHDLRRCPVVVGSPQTETQRAQVSRVIHKLMTQSRFESRTISAEGSDLSAGCESPGTAARNLAARQVAGESLQSTLLSPRSVAGTPIKTSSSTHSTPNGTNGCLQQTDSIAAGASAADSHVTVPVAVPGTQVVDTIDSVVAVAAASGDMDHSNMVESPDDSRMRLGTVDASDPLYVGEWEGQDGVEEPVHLISESGVNVTVELAQNNTEALDESAGNTTHSSGRTTMEDDNDGDNMDEGNFGSEYDDDDQVRPAEAVEVDMVNIAAPPSGSKPSFSSSRGRKSTAV